MAYEEVFGRLFQAIDRCVFRISYRNDRSERFSFPHQVINLFSNDIKEIVHLMNQGSILFRPVLDLADSLSTIGKYLKKREGVIAFTSVVTSLKWMIETIYQQHTQLTLLNNTDEQLQKKIYDFECHIAEQEQDDCIAASDGDIVVAMSQTTANDNDGLVSPSCELLTNVMKAILYANQREIKVIDCYIGCHCTLGTRKLVVHYMGFLPSEPPNSDLMVWNNMDISHSSLDEVLDRSHWMNLALNNPNALEHLLRTFHSDMCYDLIKTYSDITAIFPSVISFDHRLEPVIVLCKKLIAYKCNDDDELVVSHIDKIRLVQIQGFHFDLHVGNLTSGDSIGTAHGSGYGTICGMVQKDGKKYLLTSLWHIVAYLPKQSLP